MGEHGFPLPGEKALALEGVWEVSEIKRWPNAMVESGQVAPEDQVCVVLTAGENRLQVSAARLKPSREGWVLSSPLDPALEKRIEQELDPSGGVVRDVLDYEKIVLFAGDVRRLRRMARGGPDRPPPPDQVHPAKPDTFITLRRQHGRHQPGDVCRVVSIVHHGGYTDAPKQFVLEDQTHVPSDHAQELLGCPHPAEQRLHGGYEGRVVPRYPLLYGSAEVDICKACGAWTMPVHSPGQWNPGPYEKALKEAQEDELC